MKPQEQEHKLAGLHNVIEHFLERQAEEVEQQKCNKATSCFTS